jgi:hypothetical protein
MDGAVIALVDLGTAAKRRTKPSVAEPQPKKSVVKIFPRSVKGLAFLALFGGYFIVGYPLASFHKMPWVRVGFRWWGAAALGRS